MLCAKVTKIKTRLSLCLHKRGDRNSVSSLKLARMITNKITPIGNVTDIAPKTLLLRQCMGRNATAVTLSMGKRVAPVIGASLSMIFYRKGHKQQTTFCHAPLLLGTVHHQASFLPSPHTLPLVRHCHLHPLAALVVPSLAHSYVCLRVGVTWTGLKVFLLQDHLGRCMCVHLKVISTLMAGQIVVARIPLVNPPPISSTSQTAIDITPPSSLRHQCAGSAATPARVGGSHTPALVDS